MKKRNVLRITQDNGVSLRSFLHEDPTKESQTFAVCSHAEGPNERIYLVRQTVFPGPSDLAEQSGGSVAPTAQLQALAYGLAHDQHYTVIDFHTHPWSENPGLSGVDFHHGVQNARFIADHFPEPATMGMVVVGPSLRGFDGRVWGRRSGKFECIDELQILGSPTEILGNGKRAAVLESDEYARHLLIPGWDQSQLGPLKVFIAGLGGNGSLLFMALPALGVGRRGWIKACDPDVVEASNLSRIPYAYPEDVGKSKAEIARRYATLKAPGASVTCYQASIQTDSMMALAKEAHLLIGAVDNEGARKILNSLSVRYLIPYLSVASEIIPEEHSYQAVGQVRVVLPGRSGCLFCTRTIDPTEAALDLLSDEENQERARRGYVRGTDLTPTPSVLHLNGVASHLAISQFVRLIFGEGLAGKEFLHYDRQGCQLIAAKVEPDPECPVCGVEGYLGAGDEPVRPKTKASGETPRMLRLSQGAWEDEEDESPPQPKDAAPEESTEDEPRRSDGEGNNDG